jgi:hypothetical protein
VKTVDKIYHMADKLNAGVVMKLAHISSRCTGIYELMRLMGLINIRR